MMRTDFKIGFVGSLAVVVVASWYFARNEGLPSAIPITANDEILPLSARVANNVAQPDHRRPEELAGAFPAETVAPRIDEPVEDSLATTAANAEEYVDEPSLDDAFTAALSSESASEFGDHPRRVPQTFVGSDGVSADSIPLTTRPGPAESTLALPLSGERFETHTIQAGDTIAELARIYYGDVRYVGVLLRANPLVTDPANIPIGTPITIPDVDDISSPPPISNAQTHVVRKGDTLYTIARRRLKAASRWKEIYELNKAVIGEDPNQLPLGAALALPR